MGCDIHMVMEYRAVPGAEDRTPRWWSFGGVCNPGRDYVLFNRLAGVRGPEGGALIPARGLPDSFSHEVHGALLFSIWDTPLPNGQAVDWDARQVTQAKADEWIQGDESRRVRVGDRTYVTHPDYHSRSWLTVGEYAGVLLDLHAMGKSIAPGYWAIQAALATFADRGYEARVVFWFDN